MYELVSLYRSTLANRIAAAEGSVHVFMDKSLLTASDVNINAVLFSLDVMLARI